MSRKPSLVRGLLIRKRRCSPGRLVAPARVGAVLKVGADHVGAARGGVPEIIRTQRRDHDQASPQNDGVVHVARLYLQ
jgi:hypothetical protein